METVAVYDETKRKTRSLADALTDFEFPVCLIPGAIGNKLDQTPWTEPLSSWRMKYYDGWDRMFKQLGGLGDLKRESEDYKKFAVIVRRYFGRDILGVLDEIIEQPERKEELQKQLHEYHYPGFISPHVYPGKLVLFRWTQNDTNQHDYFVRMIHECYMPLHLNIIGEFLEEIKGEGVDLNNLHLEQDVGHGLVKLINTKDYRIRALGGAFYGINARTKEIEVYGESRAIGCSQEQREQVAGILKEQSGLPVTTVDDIVGD